MLWLDSSYPPEKAGTPGGDRGDCAQSSGVPKDVEGSIPNAYVPNHLISRRVNGIADLFHSQVVWSNVRFGPVGSTVKV